MGVGSLRALATTVRGPALAGLVVLAMAAGARADDSEPARFRALLAAGYGTQDDTDAGSFGAAFGLKLGYSPFRFLHIGAQATYHVGSDFGEGELNRVNYLGAEGGARFADELVGVTPYLTFGVASVSSQRNVENTFAALYYGAGLCADVLPIDWLMLGVDARLILISSGVRQTDNSGSTGTFDLLVLAGAQLE